jgi:hypothetical protein
VRERPSARFDGQLSSILDDIEKNLARATAHGGCIEGGTALARARRATARWAIRAIRTSAQKHGAGATGRTLSISFQKVI